MADGEPKKGRGRPAKKVAEVEAKKDEEKEISPPETKKRGRTAAVEKSPEKPAPIDVDDDDDEDEVEEEKNGESPPKKGRGRPASGKAAAPKVAVKKGRGRPPKKSAA